MKTRADDFGLRAEAVLTRDTAPNPARIRKATVLLDGVWGLSVNGGAVEPILVPFAPQAKVNGIEVPEGDVTLTYSTTFELPVGWDGGLLHFEGIDYDAEVIVNGCRLARHLGAYDPFSAFVPGSVLRLGLPSPDAVLHALVVVVRDSSSARAIVAGKQERQRREGAIFYGNMSGLWKSTWIEHVGPTHIADALVAADSAGGLRVAVEVAGGGDAHSVVLSLADEHGAPLVEATASVEDGRASLSLTVAGARPWSLADPHLYFGSLALRDARGRMVDWFETYVGFRDVAMRDGYYRLNGAPFYFQGLLNQAVYPDSLYTPTDAHTLTDFEQTRGGGFNGERRHQTTPRHRDLWLADKLGYWLSIELPAARNLLDPANREKAIDEWRRIVRAYAWNHPCVFFLVPGNENWGLLTHAHHDVEASDEDRERFQYELGHVTEEVAPPGLPYAANDGWKAVTSRKAGEPAPRLDPSRLMLNVHDYASNAELRSIYGEVPRFPEPGTWGTNPDHVFHSEEYSYDGFTPLILSEVGGRALLDRTARGVFAYGKIHRDPEAWAAELCELIELMGDLPILRGGYVLTQTRDAGNDPADESSPGELNGILDGNGRPKYLGDLLRLANDRALAAFRAVAR